MDMIGRVLPITQNMDGTYNITVMAHPIACKPFLDAFDGLRDADVDVEIKKHRERRSLNANSYLWALVGKIAEAIHPPLPKEEVYMTMLKRYGQGGVVSIQDCFVKKFKRSHKYHEEIGNATLNGKQFTHFHFWVGSSEYDTAEMALLLDGIAADAKELDIEILPPDEIARMESAWQAGIEKGGRKAGQG